jgi:hypothetical protein
VGDLLEVPDVDRFVDRLDHLPFELSLEVDVRIGLRLTGGAQPLAIDALLPDARQARIHGGEERAPRQHFEEMSATGAAGHGQLFWKVAASSLNERAWNSI